MKTYIVDYGMGNLLSVKRAFEKCGADVFIAQRPEDLYSADHIVLPGVGAFPVGIKNLEKEGFREILDRLVLQKGVPLLGICLGMQLLAAKGYEMQESEGLGYLQGEVIRMEPEKGERIPHVGWNEIEIKKNSVLLKGISDLTDFYFVHSYHFHADKKDIIATTPYCGCFTSIVEKDNIFGTQFHPEKSQKPGFLLIKNFLNF